MVLSKLVRSILSCATRAIDGAKQVKALAIAGEAHSNRVPVHPAAVPPTGRGSTEQLRVSITACPWAKLSCPSIAFGKRSRSE